jgi:putative transcriptional regulator
MTEQNYRGNLLASHPKYPDPDLRKSVILVLDHDENGAIGLQINKPYQNGVSFSTVMQNAGLYYDSDQPLFIGGQESSNRVYVIHSLDWYSPTTSKISDTLGVSTDLSILMAISQGEGPEYFQAVAGYTKWESNELEGEISGLEPWSSLHSWNYIPASLEVIFDIEPKDQWATVINISSRLQISTWF